MGLQSKRKEMCQQVLLFWVNIQKCPREQGSTHKSLIRLIKYWSMKIIIIQGLLLFLSTLCWKTKYSNIKLTFFVTKRRVYNNWIEI